MAQNVTVHGSEQLHTGKAKEECEMTNTLEEKCRHLMIQRKFEQCEKEIETAMAENPHCAIPHNLMGILMEKESNHILAMKHFRAAYALDPTYIPARYNMEQYGQMYPKGMLRKKSIEI